MKRRTLFGLGCLGLCACAQPVQLATSPTSAPPTLVLPTATASPTALVIDRPAGATAIASTPVPVATSKPTAVPQPAPTKVSLPAGPIAPAVVSKTWINSEPLVWESLRGKVVMTEFWTFG